MKPNMSLLPQLETAKIIQVKVPIFLEITIDNQPIQQKSVWIWPNSSIHDISATWKR